MREWEATRRKDGTEKEEWDYFLRKEGWKREEEGEKQEGGEGEVKIKKNMSEEK